MKISEMQDLIQILSIEVVDNIYSWKPAVEIWSKAERQANKSIYSNVGQGAKSIKFTIRVHEYDLSLFNAIQWAEQHCFITDLVHSENREYITVTAAMVTPRTCTIKRELEPTYNSLNRPVYSEPDLITFPGILTEKYLGNIQSNPMTTIETSCILVTPKIIMLQVGELVEIAGTSYEVLLAHTLDEYKSEYEIIARRNA